METVYTLQYKNILYQRPDYKKIPSCAFFSESEETEIVGNFAMTGNLVVEIPEGLCTVMLK